MDAGKMICLIDCSWVYPPHFSKVDRDHTENSTWTTLKPSWRESTKNTSFLCSYWSSLWSCCLPQLECYQMPTFPCLYRESWEEFNLKNAEGKTIVCPSRDLIQKFRVANCECSPCLSLGWILLTVLDTSVDSQLDISQFHITTLIHWIHKGISSKSNHLLFQSSMSTPCLSNLSTANLHLYHFSFIASVQLKLTLSLSYGSSISPVFLKHCCQSFWNKTMHSILSSAASEVVDFSSPAA